MRGVLDGLLAHVASHLQRVSDELEMHEELVPRIVWRLEHCLVDSVGIQLHDARCRLSVCVLHDHRLGRGEFVDAGQSREGIDDIPFADESRFHERLLEGVATRGGSLSEGRELGEHEYCDCHGAEPQGFDVGFHAPCYTANRLTAAGRGIQDSSKAAVDELKTSQAYHQIW